MLNFILLHPVARGDLSCQRKKRESLLCDPLLAFLKNPLYLISICRHLHYHILKCAGRELFQIKINDHVPASM